MHDLSPASKSSGRTKVLFVIRNLGKGGAEKVLSLLLEHLDRNKIEPCCVFYDSRHVYKIPEDVRTHSLEIPGTPRFIQKVARSIMRVVRIRKILNFEKPDVVFSFLGGVNITVLAVVLLSRCKAKVLISERNTASLHAPQGSGKLGEFLIRMLYPRADGIIAVSEGVKKDLIRHFRFPDGKIHVIHNPVEAEKVERLAKEEVTEHPWFREDVPIVINVGSLSEKKGHRHLLKAFKRIKERASARLVILGDGEMETELKRLAVDLGVEDDVAFLGFQGNPYKFMAKSSVFVLSSLWEGLPNVILEAIACGVPVVSTDCPSGPNEIIEHLKSGLLVPVADEASLADAVLKLLENPSMRKDLSAAAAMGLSKFSVPRIIAQFERLLTGPA